MIMREKLVCLISGIKLPIKIFGYLIRVIDGHKFDYLIVINLPSVAAK